MMKHSQHSIQSSKIHKIASWIEACAKHLAATHWAHPLTMHSPYHATNYIGAYNAAESNEPLDSATVLDHLALQATRCGKQFFPLDSATVLEHSARLPPAPVTSFESRCHSNLCLRG